MPSGRASAVPRRAAATPCPTVEVRDLHVALGGNPIVHGVSFTVAQGEVLALMGGNGSGKTTTVKAILGIVPILAGRIEIDGVAACEALREKVGYVPQRTSAAGGVSASCTIAASSRPRTPGRGRSRRSTRSAWPTRPAPTSRPSAGASNSES
jgi:zinc transport system ATP-binding protein